MSKKDVVKKFDFWGSVLLTIKLFFILLIFGAILRFLYANVFNY